jgi:hypothetical protein
LLAYGDPTPARAMFFVDDELVRDVSLFEALSNLNGVDAVIWFGEF